MRRTFVTAFIAVATASVIATSACEQEDECCPVSEGFSCTNFLSGGARSLLPPGGECPGAVSDNIRRMRGKRVDAKGCTYWEAEPNGELVCNPSDRVRDASMAPDADGSSDGGSDASSDASDDGALDATDASVD